MADREKVIKEFEHLLNAAKGNYQDFVDLTVDGGEEILSLLKEQEETINDLNEINRQLNQHIKDLSEYMTPYGMVKDIKAYAELLKEQEDKIRQLRLALQIMNGNGIRVDTEGR